MTTYSPSTSTPSVMWAYNSNRQQNQHQQPRTQANKPSIPPKPKLSLTDTTSKLLIHSNTNNNYEINSESKIVSVHRDNYNEIIQNLKEKLRHSNHHENNPKLSDSVSNIRIKSIVNSTNETLTSTLSRKLTAASNEILDDPNIAVSLLDEIYAEIEDKQIRTCLLKPNMTSSVINDSSNSKTDCSSSCASTSSSTNSCSCSSSSSYVCVQNDSLSLNDTNNSKHQQNQQQQQQQQQQPPPLPSVPPPPLSSETNNNSLPRCSLSFEEEIEIELRNKLNTNICLKRNELTACSSEKHELQINVEKESSVNENGLNIYEDEDVGKLEGNQNVNVMDDEQDEHEERDEFDDDDDDDDDDELETDYLEPVLINNISYNSHNSTCNTTTPYHNHHHITASPSTNKSENSINENLIFKRFLKYKKNNLSTSAEQKNVLSLSTCTSATPTPTPTSTSTTTSTASSRFNSYVESFTLSPSKLKSYLRKSTNNLHKESLNLSVSSNTSNNYNSNSPINNSQVLSTTCSNAHSNAGKNSLSSLLKSSAKLTSTLRLIRARPGLSLATSSNQSTESNNSQGVKSRNIHSTSPSIQISRPTLISQTFDLNKQNLIEIKETNMSKQIESNLNDEFSSSCSFSSSSGSSSSRSFDYESSQVKLGDDSSCEQISPTIVSNTIITNIYEEDDLIATHQHNNLTKNNQVYATTNNTSNTNVSNTKVNGMNKTISSTSLNNKNENGNFQTQKKALENLFSSSSTSSSSSSSSTSQQQIAAPTPPPPPPPPHVQAPHLQNQHSLNKLNNQSGTNLNIHDTQHQHLANKKQAPPVPPPRYDARDDSFINKPSNTQLAQDYSTNNGLAKSTTVSTTNAVGVSSSNGVKGPPPPPPPPPLPPMPSSLQTYTQSNSIQNQPTPAPAPPPPSFSSSNQNRSAPNLVKQPPPPPPPPQAAPPPVPTHHNAPPPPPPSQPPPPLPVRQAPPIPQQTANRSVPIMNGAPRQAPQPPVSKPVSQADDFERRFQFLPLPNSIELPKVFNPPSNREYPSKKYNEKLMSSGGNY